MLIENCIELCIKINTESSEIQIVRVIDECNSSITLVINYIPLEIKNNINDKVKVCA